ncbi:hypothetical protein QJS10_CPB14g01481 [Acorus calamus]|uniref:Uncharacterized protein n=1 Tax=Acorus calamus TaxID=4465 RepID=A0AAV9DCE9_ACOCL|nr:hypothetical protein QJS10_CPB14g01481 [Acorus calamus]
MMSRTRITGSGSGMGILWYMMRRMGIARSMSMGITLNGSRRRPRAADRGGRKEEKSGEGSGLKDIISGLGTNGGQRVVHRNYVKN